MCLSPTSTLFPYTTLFRSPFGIAGGGGPTCSGACGNRAPFRRAGWPDKLKSQDTQRSITMQTWLYLAAAIVAEVIDRKSTRLNSSHVAISYAVFCLNNIKR